MITIVSSLSKKEGGKLLHCTSAKQMWQTLENHYEGNVQVRSKKIQLHMYEYELFKMKPNETITDMTNRLNALVTTLRKLGKPFTKEEVNNKILRILPKKDWESRVTSIEEVQDLANLPTDVLIGKLLTHELSIKQRGEEQIEKEDKKKAIALKACQEASDEDPNEGSSNDDVKIAMLTRNFNKFLKRKLPSRSKYFNNKYKGKGKMKTKEVTCYECKKPIISKVSVQNSNSKTKEQRTKGKHSKLLGMTHPNLKWKTNKMK